jgi:hypothetical protein
LQECLHSWHLRSESMTLTLFLLSFFFYPKHLFKVCSIYAGHLPCVNICWMLELQQVKKGVSALGELTVLKEHW